jgi:pyruvate kinase
LGREIRQTKIVFTIGPATSDEETLRHLIEGGVDVCRFNMAHADHAFFQTAIARVRECCRQVGRRIAFLMDVKGPEIRARDVCQPVELVPGDLVDFFYQPFAAAALASTRDREGVVQVGVNYPGFVTHLEVGSTVLVDSGLISLVTVEVTSDRARCRVATPGTLGSRQHINLPGTKIQLATLTDKDVDDVRVGVQEAVDFFALSFVHEADDVHKLRALLREQGSDAHIIAKIENASGVEQLDGILEASDGVMVARGDLGIEVPFEQLPILQRRCVDACLRAGKPAIVATQMLESMVLSPVPTRAEITDVSNAVRERADCVMLSGETTVGRHPVECVDVLNRIISSVQRDLPGVRNEWLELKTPKEKMLRAAVDLAEQMPDAAVVAFTRSGDLARLLSAQRPTVPIFAFTDVEPVFNRMLMLWGVEPFLMDLDSDPEQTILNAFAYLKRNDWRADGAQMVVVTNVLGRGTNIIDSLQVRQIE